MVLVNPEHVIQADVVFVIEGTAVNGAYINDLKTSYIIPTLEYFSQGNLDETYYLTESATALYGIVVYHASDCLPHLITEAYGPFTSAGKVLSTIEKLELIGGKSESHAHIAEGFATALQCFEDFQETRHENANPQKHCILVCNSPPYALPVWDSSSYASQTAEQLAAVLQEHAVNLSVISPRKIPPLYKLFEIAGGDLPASQNKNYAKDPRHLVLLKGFSLKERPISPPPGTASNQPQLTTALPIPSLPSPLASNDSPISSVNTQPNQNLLGSNVTAGVGQGTIYRQPNPQGIVQLPSHSQSMVTPGMVSVGMVNTARGGIMGNPQFPNQPMPAPPGYHAATSMSGPGRPPNRWMLPPQSQQRPTFLPQGQQVNTTQGSALIAQLTQPPSSMPGSGVNQFGQMGTNTPMNPQQQQQMRMNILANQPTQQNIQTSVPQNVQSSGQTSGIVSSGIVQPSTIPQTSNPSQVAPNQVVSSQVQGGAGGQVGLPTGPARERHTIWQGLLEWIEKPKNSNDPQKVTRHVPCQVSANAKDGEPELKAEGWPTKLIMQLMPKQLIGNIGGAYLKNSKSVLFHPQNCEALDSLTKVMSSGFAGCVHFTSVQSPPCDIKVLILLYTAEKRAYLGFIPNDQAAFVDRLRKVIQQQKSTQMLRQGQGGAAGPNMNPQAVGSPMGGNVGTPPQQLPVSNTPTSQGTAQQGLMMSQTNTMAMGGGQITQNIVTSSPSGAGMGVLGQNVPAGMQPRLRMQGIPQATSPQVNQSGGNTSAMAPGIMGAPLQRAPFDNNLEAARQQNLDKINQLKQTLEAAQQQEQQYKSQLERISHMKTSQLQEALQLAQQQEMQYKILDQQRMAVNQSGPQGPGAQQQQRMMRPMMNTNNPGLRHLLQQQPQYRQQLMGMQAGMSGSGPRPQMGQQMTNNPGSNQQQTFDDVGNFDFM